MKRKKRENQVVGFDFARAREESEGDMLVTSVEDTVDGSSKYKGVTDAVTI